MENRAIGEFQSKKQASNRRIFFKRQLDFDFQQVDIDQNQNDYECLNSIKKHRKINESPQQSIIKQQYEDLYNQELQFYKKISLYSVYEQTQNLKKSKSQLNLLANFTEFRDSQLKNQADQSGQSSDPNILQEHQQFHSEFFRTSDQSFHKRFNMKQQLQTIAIEDGQANEGIPQFEKAAKQDFIQLKSTQHQFFFHRQIINSFFCKQILIKHNVQKDKKVIHRCKIVEFNFESEDKDNCYLRILQGESQIQRLIVCNYTAKGSTRNLRTLKFQRKLAQQQIDYFTLSFEYQQDVHEVLKLLQLQLY